MKNLIAETTRNLDPILAKQAHESTAETYGFVSSEKVLETFEFAGWKPVSQKVTNPRKDDRKGFQKHLVRLESDEFPEMPAVKSCRPQLVFLNSHDKASSMRLSWGLFRLICTNGLVMGDTVGEIRLNHTINVQNRLAGAIDTMLANFPKLVEQVDALANKKLAPSAVNKLIKTVYDARLAHVKNLREVEYRLPVLRAGDTGQDAFTIFNRVQEQVIKGGINYSYDRNSTRSGKKHEMISQGKTRAVTAIDESIRLNTLAYETALALV